MAPEIVSGLEYDEKCDIWSAGVILYLMLSGEHPFCGGNKMETIAKILLGNPSFESIIKGVNNCLEPIWGMLSIEAKSLIRLMLDVNQKTRITVQQARTHPWITRFALRKDSSEGLEDSLMKLQEFKAQNTFQNAVLTFIASQTVDPEYEMSVRKMFSVIDTDKNGQITKDELINGYSKLKMKPDEAAKKAEIIFQNLDLNKNGVIDYNGILTTSDGIEFIVAHLPNQQISSELNLQEAFSLFDQEKKGYISIEDLRKIFGDLPGEEKIQEIIQPPDLNKDGLVEISC